METCSKYANNKCLILILWLKFLNEPNIFQLLFSKMLSRLKPIVNHSLSMTLRKLRGFLGNTGHCCIWILGYGGLAQSIATYN